MLVQRRGRLVIKLCVKLRIENAIFQKFKLKVKQFCRKGVFFTKNAPTKITVLNLFELIAIRNNQALADCASIIFGIIGAKKHNFLNEHCHGIISKF